MPSLEYQCHALIKDSPLPAELSVPYLMKGVKWLSLSPD